VEQQLGEKLREVLEADAAVEPITDRSAVSNTLILILVS